MSDELEQLLARATRLEMALEQKGAATESVLPEGLTNDAALDLAAQGAAPAEVSVEALQVKVAELEELVDFLMGADEVKALEDGDDPRRAERDDSGPVGGCPECGSMERDELADGAVQCGDCGFVLVPASGAVPVDDEDGEAKGFDFDEADDEPAVLAGGEPAWVDDGPTDFDEPDDEQKAYAVGDDASTRLSEVELLMARRAALDA